jgi:hypothetical protein
MQNIGPRELYATLTDEEAFDYPPPRRTLCPKYEDCLEHAASRLWASFTCRGCYLEELILAGRMKELSPPRVAPSFYCLEFPIYGSVDNLDSI